MASHALSTPPPLQPLRPAHLIHFLLAAAALLAVAARPGWPAAGAEAQVIRLRQPLLRERLQNIFATSDNDQGPAGAAGPTPVPLPPPVPLALANALAAESRNVMAANNRPGGPQQPPASPRPGNILVHLAEDQEIERLEYMLKDGRLATVYQRHRDDQPNEKRQEPQYGRDSQRQPPGAGSTPLVLPPFHGEAIHLHAPQTPAAGLQVGQQTQSVHTIDLDDSDDDGGGPGDASEHSSRDLSALVLGPKLPVPGGGHPLPVPGGGYPPPVEPLLAAKKIGKLAKAKKFVKKMKPAVIMAKLKKLPKMIATKLAAKSVVGAIALDGAAGASVPLIQHHGNRFAWSTLGGGHAPAAGTLGVASTNPLPVRPTNLAAPSAGIGAGTLVSPPGGSNVIRLDSASSSHESGSFGEPLSRHELRSE